jgi:uncharacterized membrane protein YbhN (UPF0104 family)
MVKNILMSKWLRYLFSAVLLFIAFKQVNVLSLISEIISVPWWSLPALLIYFSSVMFLGGWRWAILVLDKVKFRDVLLFTKATYQGTFYGLFFPTPMAGDLIKWTSLLKSYPDVSKIKLAGTVLIDRVIGFSALCVIGFIALLSGKILGYSFPNYLILLFGLINFGLIVFYFLVFAIDFESIIGRFKKFKKVAEIVGLLRKANKLDLLFVFGICVLSEPLWMGTTYLIALIFGLDLRILDVLIFMPIIALILVLPISIAGFGARETLFVYFFSQLGLPADSILAVSTFNGIAGIFSALIGGVLTFF